MCIPSSKSSIPTNANKWRKKNIEKKEKLFHSQNARKRQRKVNESTGIVPAWPNGHGPTRPPWYARHSGQHVRLDASTSKLLALDRGGVSDASSAAGDVPTTETCWIDRTTQNDSG